MPNQNSPINGQGEAIDLMVDLANVAHLKAAGDSLGTPTGSVDPSASQLVQLHKAATAPSTRVASSATSEVLLTANAARKGVSIYNESTQVLYVRLAAAAASPTTYWLAMAANSYAEVPFGYTGEIRGIWASANGAAMMTESV